MGYHNLETRTPRRVIVGRVRKRDQPNPSPRDWLQSHARGEAPVPAPAIESQFPKPGQAPPPRQKRGCGASPCSHIGDWLQSHARGGAPVPVPATDRASPWSLSSRPARFSVRLAGLDPRTNGSQFSLVVRLINDVDPIGRPLDRRLCQPTRVSRSTRPPQARPFPVFGLLNQSASQRVSLDVSNHPKQVLVFLDRNRLEATLPEMATTGVILSVAVVEPAHDSLHPTAEITVGDGPNDQVKVIGHQAVRE